MSIRKIASVIALSCAAFVSANAAHAQGVTRDQVRQELIQAQQDGAEYVTNASYPDVSPIYQNQIAQRHAERMSEHDMGSDTSGSTQAGHAALPMTQTNDACVGPVSFCNTYFGS
jgi:hypothetical protein